MGDQLYAYRSKYSSGHGDDDGTLNGRSYGGDKVCRTNVYSGDGRQRPVPGHNETYVIQTEVTESYVHPTSNFHRYGSPTQSPPPMRKVTEQYAAPYGIGRTYADKPHGFSSPTRYNDRNRCPPEVDNFLTGVQIEASRAHVVHSPRSAYGPRGHGQINGRFDDRTNYRDHRKDSNYDSGSDDDSDRERDDDRYSYKPNKVATAKTTTTWSEVSSPKAYRQGTAVRLSGSPPSHGSGRLGLPTSNIEELVHGLKVSTGGKPHEYGTQYGAAPEAVKPYGHAYNSGYSSDGTTKYRQTPEAVKPYGGEVAKPYGYGHEAAKPYGAATKYGGGANYFASSSSSSSSVIDCYEAAKKYNGKVIRT